MKKAHLRHPSSGWVPGALARRCDVWTKYASDPPAVGARGSRAAWHLDLFEQPSGKRVFQHPAKSWGNATASATSSMRLIPAANSHNWQTLGVPRQA